MLLYKQHHTLERCQLDKASDRDEVICLKVDLNQLNAEGEIPDQVKVQMRSML